MNDKVVLIADDDEADTFFVSEALKKASPGVFIACVADGQQAVDYLAGPGPYADRSAWPFPTCLLLDLKMPLLSGLEVLQWLRRQPPEIGRLPVTVLSGSELASDIQQVRALGADYIVKPIEYAALRAVMRDFAQKFLR